MRLTAHGHKRILGRTKMTAQDVLRLITFGAAVDLGEDRGFRYLLFYSPFDASTKIAVISSDYENLVSIWERDFVLPSGILPVSEVLEKEARAVFERFLFAEIPRDFAEDPLPFKQYVARIAILFKGRMQGIRKCGVTVVMHRHIDYVWPAVMPDFEALAAAIETLQYGKRAVRYQLELLAHGHDEVPWIARFRHDTILKWLHAEFSPQ